MLSRKPSKNALDLNDMSRLRVIAHLQENGSHELAARMATQLKKSTAKDVAKALTKSGKSRTKSSQALAKDLRAWAKPSKGSLMSAGGTRKTSHKTSRKTSRKTRL